MTKRDDAGVRAAKAQAARLGCAKPLGWARWDFDGEVVALRGGDPRLKLAAPSEIEGAAARSPRKGQR